MNKPVAWMSPDGKVSNTEGKLFYIPLYTHQLELSDVDIDNLVDQFWNSDDAGFHFHYYDFAKAILRKAQEK